MAHPLAAPQAARRLPWLLIICGCLIAALTFGPRSAMGFFQLPMLAEKGCTPHQIKAITGHMTLKEVERYTLEVRQKDLAVEAMQKL